MTTMKSFFLQLSLLAITSLALVACKSDLKSASGLYDVKLEHNYKIPVDGFWISHEANAHAGQKTGSFYVAPLKVAKMEKEYPDLAQRLQAQMHDHMVESLNMRLAEMNAERKIHWTVTENPAKADVVIELAVVEFVPQRVIGKIISSVLGIFIDIPGVSNVTDKLTKGSICVEGVIRDGRTGKTYIAFKDSNRKTVRLFRANAYEKLGQADENMKLWAERLANTIYMTRFDENKRSTLGKKIEERSWWFTIWNQAGDQI